MDAPEIPSMKDFSSGEDNSGNKWYAATFAQDGVDLKANNYENGYSTSWGTYKSFEDVLDDINSFYRLKGSVDVIEMRDGEASPRHHRLTQQDASISDYDFEDVIHVDLESDDFGIQWAENSPKMQEKNYIPSNTVHVYVNEPVEEVPEPFMEPTWLLMQETLGYSEDNRETVSQLTHDAGRFLNQTEDLL
ncbi:hypothetical protein GKQ38_02110 [Candidatus Nanohaloarchaea archaeon]|nr:hypothetical protein GKQ38_02110 [Candidatus Nanohaloarchaea archaeon]